MCESMNVYKTTWIPEDQLNELDSILQGVSPEEVENQLVKYVVAHVEPVGWKAIWRPDTDSLSFTLFNTISDFLVEVKNVSLDSLEACVDVLSSVISEEKSYSDGKEMTVPLIQLFPLAEQDNPHLDIAGTAEVVDQVRFFFDNIWLPWDIEEDHFSYTKTVLTSRMILHTNIKTAKIPPVVGNEIRVVVKEAIAVRKLIDEIDNTESDTTQMFSLLRLHKKLDNCKSRYNILSDPVLREMAIHQNHLDRQEMLQFISCREPNKSKVLLVCSSLSLEEFAQCVVKLPDVLKGLKDVPADTKLQTFPTLQIALDCAKIGDTVILLPGKYVLNHLGELAQGGAICGLGGPVEIGGSWVTGDVLLDLSPREVFTLHSVIIKGVREKIGIVLHKGNLLLYKCSIEGFQIGLSSICESKCRLEHCSISGSKTHAIKCANNSEVMMFSSEITNCGENSIKREDRAVCTLRSVKVTEILDWN